MQLSKEEGKGIRKSNYLEISNQDEETKKKRIKLVLLQANWTDKHTWESSSPILNRTSPMRAHTHMQRSIFGDLTQAHYLNNKQHTSNNPCDARQLLGGQTKESLWYIGWNAGMIYHFNSAREYCPITPLLDA